MSEHILYTEPLLDQQPPASPSHKTGFGLSAFAHWRYLDNGGTRDLRIDFMRGFVFLILFSTHFDYFSLFSMLGWERIWVVTSAETFIFLAGIVTGAVYGKRFKTEGLSAIITKLFSRAWSLYKIAFIVAASVALLHLIPNLNTLAITAYIDETGKAFPLYPEPDKGFMYNLLYIIFMKSGPHQFQVVGLYMVLFLITPFIFWAIDVGKVRILLLLSWAAYLINYFMPETEPGIPEIRLTGAEFEEAFPLVAWQLLFVHGVIIGYYRKNVVEFFQGVKGRAFVIACFVLSILFAVFACNQPADQIPEWAKLRWMAPETFNWWYQNFFLKYNLGPGRLLNNLALFVSSYVVLTVAWKPIDRSMGWLFIPLGQESMYVFFMHIYLILLIENTPLPQMHNVWINTAIHISMLLTCWFMVKHRFLFRWVPR